MTEFETTVIGWVWAILLVLIVAVIVPLAVHLLRRASRAAANTRRYAEEMLEAGVAIAGHTANIKALDATMDGAGKLLAAGNDLESLAGALRSTLVARA